MSLHISYVRNLVSVLALVNTKNRLRKHNFLPACKKILKVYGYTSMLIANLLFLQREAICFIYVCFLVKPTKSFRMVSTIKGKNLLLEEQIFS